MMLRTLLLGLSCVCFGVSVVSWGALPTDTKLSKSTLLRILDLPSGSRDMILREKKISLEDLEQFARNPRSSLQMRWRAITSLPAVKGSRKQTLSYLRGHLKSKTWWQRSAALISLDRLDTELAVEAAFELMRDPALMVRSSAVDLIARKGSSQDKSRLWGFVNDKINFHRGQGLWVRQQIIETLAKDRIQPTDQFRYFANDKDQKVRKIARARLQN